MSYASGGTLSGVLRLSAPAPTPSVAPAGEGRIYFDGSVFQMSANGGAFAPVATTVSAGGWTDDGTVVRLSDVTDGVGIGTAAPAASSRLEVLGDTTRKNVVVTGGGGGTTSNGGSVSFLAGAGGSTSGTGGFVSVTAGAGVGVSAAGGTLSLAGGAGGSSGNGGALSVVGGGASNANGGTLTLAGGSVTSGNGGGGAVTVAGGNSFGTLAAGSVSILGGNTSGGGAAAGSVLIAGGAGAGGSATLRGGNAVANNDGGAVFVTGGAGSGVGNGASVTIAGGAAGANNATPGNVVIVAGATGGGINSPGASVSIASTTGGANNSPGSITLTSAASSSTSAGGAITMTTGAGGPTSGNGGGFTITTGGARGGSTGGAVTLTAGSGISGNSNGGTVNLVAGSATGSGAGGVVQITSGTSPTGATGSIRFSTGTTGAVTERARIDGGGTLFLGDGTAGSWATGPFPSISLVSYRNTGNTITPYAFSATATDQPMLGFARGRGTAASPAAVTSGDALGQVQFAGFSSATTGTAGATVRAEVDGTVSTNVMPGRLILSTTPAGSGTPVERMRIVNLGTVRIGASGQSVLGTPTSASEQVHIQNDGQVTARQIACGTGVSNISNFMTGRGTLAAPTALSDGDLIGSVGFQAAINGAGGWGSNCTIQGYADGTQTGSSGPGRVVVNTCPSGTLSPVERLRINSAGTTFFGDGTLSSTFWPANAIYSQFAYRDTHSFLVNAAFASDSGTRPVALNIKGRGTAATPAAVSPSDFLHTTSWRGITSAATQADFVECYIAADDNPFTGGLTVSSTSAPGRYTLHTTPNGSIIPVERLRINSFGTVFVSDGTMRANFPAYFGDALSVYRDAAAASSVWSFSAAAATTASVVRLGRGRGTADTPAAVVDGDTLGTISFDGATSNTAFSPGATIAGFVDGTPGTGDMPVRLVFSTTPDGTAAPVERLRINNAGVIFVGNGETSTTPNNGIVAATGGSTTQAGASLSVDGGVGGATSGDGGGVSVRGGLPTDGNGGSVSIAGRAGVGTNRSGGDVTLTPGAATGTGIFGTLVLNKGVRYEVRTSITGATSLTGADPLLVQADSTGGAFAITLPTAAAAGSGRVFAIKDVGGAAATNNITISASGGAVIDGAASYVMTVNYEAITIFCNGTDWFLL